MTDARQAIKEVARRTGLSAHGLLQPEFMLLAVRRAIPAYPYA